LEKCIETVKICIENVKKCMETVENFGLRRVAERG
jgi:hypothetical protein